MKIPLTVLSSRATPITSNDKSESVTLATWILMGVFVVMFLAREAIKTVVFKKLALDDLFILLATIFGIALSVTTIVLAAEGLGVLGVLTLNRANTLMKGLYASDFLYVLSICFAKLSLVTFFYGVLVQGTHRRFVLGFGAFIFIWSLASIGAIAFQCGLPKPWEILSLHCYDRGAFWVAYCIIDMTTDVSIIMLSVNLVAYLRVKLSRKIAVVACFAPRVLVMVASLVRLIYLYPVNPHRNPEFKLWGPVICTQVQVCLSISTACIPYMVPFFKSLESGVWRVRSMRSRDVRISDLYGWGTSRKSGRGMKKAKQLGSVDSTAFANWNNDRTAEASPRIPSPRPLSPLTPPRIITPPNTSHGSSRSPSERRLKLHIPPPPALAHRAAEDTLSPQTASSHALSPQCLSPQVLLSPTIASPIRREPTSPQRSYSPKPQSPGAYYKPADLPTPSPARAAPRFSLFPIPPTTRYTPLVAQPPCPLVSFRKAPIPEKQIQNRIFLPQASSNISVQHEPPSNAEYPPRKSSLRRDTSVVAHNASCSPASIPSYYQRNTKTPPTAHTSASSNPQVPSYYYNTAPITSPPDSALPQPPSPQRVRNHRILQPQNSSRRDQISPVSPASPRTPLNFWREEQVFHSANMSAGASTGPIPLQRPWTNEPMPVIQDKRNSPRIIVQKPS